MSALRRLSISRSPPRIASDADRPPLTRPTKKTTMAELQKGLEQVGLDSKGKKDTLFRRLLNFFKRSTPSPEDVDENPEKAEISQSGQTRSADAASIDETPAPIVPARTPANGMNSPSKPRNGRQIYGNYLCFDVEATCRGGREYDYPNEIIEFPVVLLRWVKDAPANSSTQPSPISPSSSIERDAGPSSPRRSGGKPEPSTWAVDKTLQVVDTFQTYVRPTWRPTLTDFCVNLTGIQQSTVDAAPTWPEAIKLFEAWLDKWDLRQDDGLKDAVWVTDGPWDIRDFIPKQLHIAPLTPHRYPAYLTGSFVNLKEGMHTYLAETKRRTAYALANPGKHGGPRQTSRITTGRRASRADGAFYFTITGQLEKLGLQFEGRQHSGIADATNIGRILIALVERNVLIETNMQVNPGAKKWIWMGRPGEVLWNEETDSAMLVSPSTPPVQLEPVKETDSTTIASPMPLAPVPEPVRTTAKPDEIELNRLLGVAA